MQKNVTGQKFIVFAFDSTANTPKTGDAAQITCYISKDFGSVTQTTDTSATEMDSTNAKGYYLFDATQGETNADIILVSGKSSTSNIVVVGAPATIFTTPANFTTTSISSTGGIATQGNVKKGVALSKFTFLMTDSTNHNPATSKTVAITISKDGSAFGALNSGDSVTEIAFGAYEVDLSTTDTNANIIILRATATGCDDTFIRILTSI
jgi:hypothetical protein